MKITENKILKHRKFWQQFFNVFSAVTAFTYFHAIWNQRFLERRRGDQYEKIFLFPSSLKWWLFCEAYLKFWMFTGVYCTIHKTNRQVNKHLCKKWVGIVFEWKLSKKCNKRNENIKQICFPVNATQLIQKQIFYWHKATKQLIFLTNLLKMPQSFVLRLSSLLR